MAALNVRRDRVLERTQVVPVEVDEAFAFFADPWNLEAITPPWLGFRILEAPPTLEIGSLLGYRLRLFGLPFRWRTEIVAGDLRSASRTCSSQVRTVVGSTRIGSPRSTAGRRSTTTFSTDCRSSLSPVSSGR